MGLVVIDEDSASHGRRGLAQLGHTAIDVREAGLEGSSDDVVFDCAQRRRAVLLTGDLGFSDARPVSPRITPRHRGLQTSSSMTNAAVNAELARSLATVPEKQLTTSLMIVERPGASAF